MDLLFLCNKKGRFQRSGLKFLKCLIGKPFEN